MTLNSTAEWKAQADEWMLERIRDTAPPGSLSDCLQDEGWASIYYFFTKSEFNTENVDFIAKVDAFRRSGDMNLAKQIYNEHVADSSPAQVNLSGPNRASLDEIFKDQEEPIGPPDLYDGAYNEILSMTNNDSYRRFVGILENVRKELGEEIDWDNVEGRDRS